MSFQLRGWQMDRLAEALDADRVAAVERHLRAHYPEQCEPHDSAALREWIVVALEHANASGAVTTQDMLLHVSTRWVLRAWFGAPPEAPGAKP